MKNAGPWREKGALLLTFVCCFSGAGFAQFTVSAATSPPNDNFENRTKVSGSAIIANGSNAGATRQPGEPFHGDSSGGVSVWWSWTAAMAGPCTVSTEGSSFYTLLSVYCGGSLTNLARVGLAPLFSGTN